MIWIIDTVNVFTPVLCLMDPHAVSRPRRGSHWQAVTQLTNQEKFSHVGQRSLQRFELQLQISEGFEPIETKSSPNFGAFKKALAGGGGSAGGSEGPKRASVHLILLQSKCQARPSLDRALGSACRGENI